MTDKNMFLKNYYFYGKQREMVIALTSPIDNDSGAAAFTSAVELFIMSAFVGVARNHKARVDADKTQRTNIMAEQFNSHSAECKLAFKFAMLLGNQEKYDAVTRLNKTFRNPETDQNYQEFEEYMLGGLEEIYNSLKVATNIRYEDYLTASNKFLDSFASKENDELDDHDNPDTSDFF